MYVFDQCIFSFTASNKESMNPQAYKAEPDFRRTDGVWIQGYSFKHFWGNCAALLGDVAEK